MDLLKEVNTFFNRFPYRTDQDAWGMEEFWATPAEFMRSSGDTEDYAIAKYYALRCLGIPASQMRIALVQDTIRNLGHAVLAVNLEGKWYLLDNITPMILPSARLEHYKPVYSVNEDYFWTAVKNKKDEDKK